MNLQWSGPLLAGLTFLTIGFGHILVRRLHARFGTLPGVPLVLLGAAIFGSSLASASDLLSAGLGLVGITCLWDGIEIYRQERRVRRDG